MSEVPTWVKVTSGFAMTAGLLAGCGDQAQLQSTSAGQKEILGQISDTSGNPCPEFDYDQFKRSDFTGVSPNSLFSDLQTKDENGDLVPVPDKEAASQFMQQSCNNAARTAVLGAFLDLARNKGANFEDTTSLNGGIKALYDKITTDEKAALDTLAAIDDQLPYVDPSSEIAFPKSSAQVIVPIKSASDETTGLQYKPASLNTLQTGWYFGINEDDASLTPLAKESLLKEVHTYAVNELGQFIVTVTTGNNKFRFQKDATQKTKAEVAPSAEESVAPEERADRGQGQSTAQQEHKQQGGSATSNNEQKSKAGTGTTKKKNSNGSGNTTKKKKNTGGGSGGGSGTGGGGGAGGGGETASPEPSTPPSEGGDDKGSVDVCKSDPNNPACE